MSNENIQSVIQEAFADKEFVANLGKITTAEEAQKAFNAKGIKMTLDEVQQLGDLMAQQEELAENALDNIAGGFAITAGYAVIISGVAICAAAAGVKILWGKLTG